LQVARNTKILRPQTTVVFGGFHPSIYPKETLQCSPDVDIAIAGEAEETFCTVIDNIASGRDLAGIPGVSFRSPDGVIHHDARVPFVQDLNGLPMPDRTMVNYQKHQCIIGSKGMSTNILSSRGCPFKCTYCYVNVKNYRLRTLDNLQAEIRHCLSLGIREFFFMDDLFNITKQRVIDFSEMISREGLDISWSFRGRVDQINEEVLEKAKKAGCNRVHYGVESGVPEILKRVHKGTNLEMVRSVISMTRKTGIEVSSNIMIGLPGETPAMTEQTIRFLLSLRTNYVQAAVFTPYPETPLYREGLQSGLFTHDYWREFALAPKEDFEPMIWGEFYTREQLFNKLRQLYRRFYLRPSFIIQYLKGVNNLQAVRLMMQNALTMLKLILKRGVK